MLGMGNNPSVSMWLNEVDEASSETWQVAVVYMGINSEASDPSGCGIANIAPNTIKTASWSLAQNYFMNSPIDSFP
jgi:hypothetical protein